MEAQNDKRMHSHVIQQPLGKRRLRTTQNPNTVRMGWQIRHANTCIVPSSAANALPTRPAKMTAQMTGDNSRAKARASTPPTDRVRPKRANSRTNCIVKTMPTKQDVSNTTPIVRGPTAEICGGQTACKTRATGMVTAWHTSKFGYWTRTRYGVPARASCASGSFH
eukprot:scaffold781_cov394-Prasinococcus_capsulatus_cf.AAC.34